VPVSATAVRATDTIAIELPVQMIGGPHGWDSPAVHGEIPRFRWYSWLQLAADRAARAGSALPVIEWALGHRVHSHWTHWWLAPDDDTWRVHYAQITDVDGGGQMLLATCLRSAPWIGPNDDVVAIEGRELPDTVKQCQVCALATA
jgi:hypothetical protein